MKKSTAFILWLIAFLAGVVVGVLAAMKIMLEEDDEDYDFDEEEDFAEGDEFSEKSEPETAENV